MTRGEEPQGGTFDRREEQCHRGVVFRLRGGLTYEDLDEKDLKGVTDRSASIAS